jgi:Terminase small subunit
MPGPLKNYRREQFAQRYAVLANASEAYRQTYNKDSTRPDVMGHQILVNAEVKERVAELRRENERKAGFNREKAIELLADIAMHGEKDSDRVAAMNKIGQWSGWDQPQRIVVTADPFTDYLQEMRQVPLLREPITPQLTDNE